MKMILWATEEFANLFFICWSLILPNNREIKIISEQKGRKLYTRIDACYRICVCGCIQKLKQASIIDRSMLIHADMYLEKKTEV